MSTSFGSEKFAYVRKCGKRCRFWKEYVLERAKKDRNIEKNGHW